METTNLLELIIDDGGRFEYTGETKLRDCSVRALAIAGGIKYPVALSKLNEVLGYNPQNGIKPNDKGVFSKLGYKWVSCFDKQNRTYNTHLCNTDLPLDKPLICLMNGHYVAVVNGVVYDKFDSRQRDGILAPIMGYWIIK